jgi:ABC-type uncharacterized transport system permease subunit
MRAFTSLVLMAIVVVAIARYGGWSPQDALAVYTVSVLTLIYSEICAHLRRLDRLVEQVETPTIVNNFAPGIGPGKRGSPADNEVIG